MVLVPVGSRQRARRARDLHCIGGFIVSQYYRLSRETGDLDVLTVTPANARVVRIFPAWANVRLWALEPHDLALTKLERSNDRDIRDVIYLAQAVCSTGKHC